MCHLRVIPRLEAQRGIKWRCEEQQRDTMHENQTTEEQRRGNEGEIKWKNIKREENEVEQQKTKRSEGKIKMHDEE